LGPLLKIFFGTIKDFDRQLIAVGKLLIYLEDLKQFGREVVELRVI
jgi:hypothetical protein